jgi:hypothetical protein
MSLTTLAVPLAKSGEAAKSGPIGLAVILILCIGCYFLFKSMSKHLRIVREEFPSKPETGPGGGPSAAPLTAAREAHDPAGGAVNTPKAVIVSPKARHTDSAGDPGPADPAQPGP